MNSQQSKPIQYRKVRFSESYDCEEDEEEILIKTSVVETYLVNNEHEGKSITLGLLTALVMCAGMNSQRWILSFNLVMMVLLAVVMSLSILLLLHPWMELFPLQLTDPPLVVALVLVPAEFLWCMMGMLATCFSCRRLLRAFYIGLVVSLLLDALLGLFWAFRFNNLHATYETFLQMHWRTRLIENDLSFCELWLRMERELECCAVHGLEDIRPLSLMTTQSPNHSINSTQSIYTDHNFDLSIDSYCVNASLPSQCVANAKSEYHMPKGCMFELLRWLHRRVDVLTMLGYCLIYLLKLGFTVILRQEIRFLLEDLFNGRYKGLFNHWANDHDVIDEVQVLQPGGEDLDSKLAHNNQLTVAEVSVRRKKISQQWTVANTNQPNTNDIQSDTLSPERKSSPPKQKQSRFVLQPVQEGVPMLPVAQTTD